MKNVVNLIIVIGWLGSGLMMLGSAEALATPKGDVMVLLLSVFCFFISSMVVVWINVIRIGRRELKEMMDEEERECRNCSEFKPWGKSYEGKMSGEK